IRSSVSFVLSQHQPQAADRASRNGSLVCVPTLTTSASTKLACPANAWPPLGCVVRRRWVRPADHHGERGAIGNAKLLEDMMQVNLDRSLTESQSACNLLVWQAF